MTEKQGGSDVRANTTRAEKSGDAFTLTGHKWFCSAPMCDAFLTLAYTDKGLTCFLVPRWKPDGERNAMHIMRLKDKLGDRANASSEIEYHGAYARHVGEEGRGVKTIIEMVHHTRLDCTIAPAAYMRQALAQALWHTAHRTAFQKKLIDQPLMARVLADLALGIRSGHRARLPHRPLVRRRQKRGAVLAPRHADRQILAQQARRELRLRSDGMPRRRGLRGRIRPAAPLPPIAAELDLGRLGQRHLPRRPARSDPRARNRRRPLRRTRRRPRRLRGLDKAIDAAKQSLASVTEPGARRLVETLALTLQASLLARHAPTAIADGFIATRLGDAPWRTYGAFEAEIDINAIVARAMPAA